MTQQETKDRQSQSWDAIKGALNLCGDSSALKEYYDRWASTYDGDVSKECYSGPECVVNYLIQLGSHHQVQLNTKSPDLSILDAGCGTGLVGFYLRKLGYRNVDGFDLSPTMVEKARKTNAYMSLFGGCDMTRRIEVFEDGQYDAVLCCGVFTTGHVPPIAITELIRITKPGGLIVATTRKSYYETTDFQAVCDRLQAENKVKLVSVMLDGPYLEEEGAHYWAFKVN